MAKSIPIQSLFSKTNFIWWHGNLSIRRPLSFCTELQQHSPSARLSSSLKTPIRQRRAHHSTDLLPLTKFRESWRTANRCTTSSHEIKSGSPTTWWCSASGLTRALTTLTFRFLRWVSTAARSDLYWQIDPSQYFKSDRKQTFGRCLRRIGKWWMHSSNSLPSNSSSTSSYIKKDLT